MSPYLRYKNRCHLPNWPKTHNMYKTNKTRLVWGPAVRISKDWLSFKGFSKTFFPKNCFRRQQKLSNFAFLTFFDLKMISKLKETVLFCNRFGSFLWSTFIKTLKRQKVILPWAWLIFFTPVVMSKTCSYLSTMKWLYWCIAKGSYFCVYSTSLNHFLVFSFDWVVSVPWDFGLYGYFSF